MLGLQTLIVFLMTFASAFSDPTAEGNTPAVQLYRKYLETHQTSNAKSTFSSMTDNEKTPLIMAEKNTIDLNTFNLSKHRKESMVKERCAIETCSAVSFTLFFWVLR